jgi:hypothetical protein
MDRQTHTANTKCRAFKTQLFKFPILHKKRTSLSI